MHQGLPICCVIRASLPYSVSLPDCRLCDRSNTTTCLPSTILAMHFTVGSPMSAPWESSGSVCGLIQSMLGENTHNIHHQQGTNPRKFPTSLMTINSNYFPSVVPLSTERLLSDRDIIKMHIHSQNNCQTHSGHYCSHRINLSSARAANWFPNNV